MAQSVILRGADLKLFLGGKLYPPVTAFSYTINYGETEIYGIDSVFPQEIAVTKVIVTGTVQGLRIKGSGGLQGYRARSLITDVLHSSYISLRAKDRHSDADIIWIPQVKISSEQFSVNAKGVGIYSFNFKGIIPYNPIDVGGIG